MHFAITICELVIGIVRRFLKVSLSRSIKKRSAATIPKMQGRSSNIPKPITDCHRASKAAAFVAYLFCAVFRSSPLKYPHKDGLLESQFLIRQKNG